MFGFLATWNATITNKKLFKLQRGCQQASNLYRNVAKSRGSFYFATRNATIAVAKWGVAREFFLATCNGTLVALQIARKIASCNMALKLYGYIPVCKRTIASLFLRFNPLFSVVQL